MIGHRLLRSVQPSVPLVLLTLYLVLLLIAGGASRADAPGQAIARGGACSVLAIVALFGSRLDPGRAKSVLYLLLSAISLVLLQLVPLPLGIWESLAGRSLLTQAAHGEQPWRPLSIVPGATLNAAASLLVPLSVLVLLLGLRVEERCKMVTYVLGLIAFSMLVGLLQFSGVHPENPFINDYAGTVSGSFANHNHFALLLAFGCLIAPVWPFLDERRMGWRAPSAIGLVLLFLLLILASGSRAGMVLGVLGLILGLVIAQREIMRYLKRLPWWATPVIGIALVCLILTTVIISIEAGRARSVTRAMTLDVGEDMRMRALPIVIDLVRSYFPVGTGFGGFDPIFRISEPFHLLKPTYFNHAHNDFLEVMVDAGLPGLLLVLAVAVWWAWASVRAWRAGSGMRHAQPRLGSSMLFLVAIASIVDYPARTPMIMAVMVIAATWLSGHSQGGKSSALPKSD